MKRHSAGFWKENKKTKIKKESQEGGGKCDSFDPFAFVLRSGGDDIDINDDESFTQV